MTGFVHNASWTRHYAISEIVSIGKAIKRENSYGQYHEAKLRDGDTIFLNGTDVDRLTDPVVATLPAGAGYSTLHVGTDESGEDWVYRETVIAWQMTSLGEMVPITIQGPNDNMFRRIPVEKPDGEIWCPEEDASYANLDLFRAAERVRAENRATAQAPQSEESA